MTKVIIIGTSTEFILDSPNEIYHDKESGLSALVSNGKLINAPTDRLLVIADIKNDKKEVIGKKGEAKKDVE